MEINKYYCSHSLGSPLCGTVCCYSADCATGHMITTKHINNNDAYFATALSIKPTMSHMRLVDTGIDEDDEINVLRNQIGLQRFSVESLKNQEEEEETLAQFTL